MVVVTAPVSVPLLAAALIVGSAAAIGAGIGDVYDSRQAGDSWPQSVSNGAGTALLGLAIVDTLGAACEALCAPSVVTGGGGGGGDEPPGNPERGTGGNSSGNAENPSSSSRRYSGAADGAGHLSDAQAKTLADALRPDKVAHVFDPKHNFGPLVETYGSEEAAMEQIVRSLDGVALPSSGTFEVTTQVAGQSVVIRGAVVDGVARIGTAFTP